MPSFTDLAGRTWPVRITAADAIALKEVGVDVGKLDEQTLATLCDDPVALVAALWVVCRPLDRHGLDEVEFARGLAGDTLDQATTAFLEALADFFPSPKRRVLRAALRTINRIVETNAEKAIETMAKIDPAHLTSGGTSSSSPPSSANRPGHTPSASSTGWPEQSSSTDGTTPAPSSPNKPTSTPAKEDDSHPQTSTRTAPRQSHNP